MPRIFVFLALIAALMHPAVSRAENKLALVVGINSYPSLPPEAQLQRAVQDAASVGDAFSRIGFTVTRLTKDVDEDAFIRGFEKFAATIEHGDTVAFFYAGHGVSLDDGNYLLPANVSPVEPGDELILKKHAISEHELEDRVRAAGAKVVVMVFDACRDNPFPRKHGRAIGPATRGLARIAGADGLFLLYSADEAQTALDRLNGQDDDPNSVFTRVFLKALGKPGLSLSEMGSIVRDEVATLARSDNHDQVPAVYDRLVGSRTVFLGVPAPSVTSVDPTPSATPTLSVDDFAWSFISTTTDVAQLEEFVRRYPQSPHRKDAEARISDLGHPSRDPPHPAAPAPDEIAWSFIGGTTDRAQLMDFVHRFPTSSHRSEAEEKIRQLSQSQYRGADSTPEQFAPSPDEVAWSLLRTTRDTDSIQALLRRFPATRLRPQIEARLTELYQLGAKANALGMTDTESVKVVRSFYAALASANGEAAASLVVPDKRQLPTFSPDAINAFYSRLKSPLKVISILGGADNTVLVRYRYVKASGGLCVGNATVSTNSLYGQTLIERIAANC